MTVPEKEKAAEKNKKKRKGLIAVLIIAAAAAIAGAFFILRNNSNIFDFNGYQYALLQLRGAYREASAVIEGECMRFTQEEDGTCYSFYKVINIISGAVKENGEEKLITVISADEIGTDHLLYLKKDDERSEETTVYSVVDGSDYSIGTGGVIFDERTTIPLSVIKADIDKLRREIAMPSQYFYYKNREKLMENCQCVFIGRITSVYEERNVTCVSVERGEELKRRSNVRTIEAEVVNGLNTDKEYGEKIIIKIPDRSDIETIDEATNEVFAYDYGSEQLKKGDVCVFFLIESSDEKEDFYFLVNAYQGYIKTEGDSIIPCPANGAFTGIRTLREAVKRILAAASNN